MIGILYILGGLALFMFGIRLLSTGMEKLAGNKIQQWLSRVTESRLRGAGFGALATAFLQSSGLLMVTMIGLINANLMTVQQSIGIMLGQEVGTTITAQIVAYDIGASRLLLVIMGFIFLEYFEQRDWKKYGEILMGLGLIFIGMSYMASALDHLMTVPAFSDFLETTSHHPYAGIVAGLITTAVTQSSTAVTSMAVAMGMKQAITLEGSLGIILGANIGSCVTGFVASLGQSRSARQASIAQILINVFGVLLFLPFIDQYAGLVCLTSHSLPRQIANAHTIFNLSVSAILFPFVKQLDQVSARLTPVSRKPEKAPVTVFIDKMQFSVPSVALNAAARELIRIGEVTVRMVHDSCVALIGLDSRNIQSVLALEKELVDPVNRELAAFINMLMNRDLTLAQQHRCFQIKNLLVDIERVGDMAEDIAEYAQERIDSGAAFNPSDTGDLEHLWNHAYQTYSMAVRAFSEDDKELARQVSIRESEFDRLYWKTRQSHILRVSEGGCRAEADTIFTETLRLLERISDHADNLAVSVIHSHT